MMLRKLSIFALPALLVIGLCAAASNATMIGVKYTDTGSAGTTTLAAGDVAGYTGYTQANWNNTATNGQNPPNTPINGLNDSTGTATTVNITAWTQTSPNSWAMGDTASPKAILLNAFSDQQPSITFSGLGTDFTTNGYSVVVYYSNNEGPATSTLSLTGSVNDSVSRDIRTGNTAQCSYSAVGFIEGTDANSATVTNFTVFTGLNDGGFTVALTGANNNGIAAVQIVSNPVPEPASLALLGLGGLCMIRRRRRA